MPTRRLLTLRRKRRAFYALARYLGTSCLPKDAESGILLTEYKTQFWQRINRTW